MTLVARTRRLDADIDLLAVAGRDGLLFERNRLGLAGRGCARRIAWPPGDPSRAAHVVADALAAIAVDDPVGHPGCGPVAFGALPFVPGAGSELIVPALVVGRAEDGTRWVTTIGPDGGAHGATQGGGDDGSPGSGSHAPADLAAPDDRLPWPSTFAVRSEIDPARWCALVERAARATAGHDLDKVVLARQVTVTTDRPIDRRDVLTRLRAGYPGCHLASVDGLVAASPELLVSVSGDVVRSHPMAGTASRGGDPATDQRLAASLLASAKDRREHQLTIDVVHDTLLPWCSYVDYEAEPSVVAVANVQHLATLVEGRLSHPPPSALELVAALHPTPAVAGHPREPALRWIADHERLDRRRYAGAAGWVDARGNGTWAVTVRCAEIEGTGARLWAGGGIVADSDPATELDETRAKLHALLSAIVRP